MTGPVFQPFRGRLSVPEGPHDLYDTNSMHIQRRYFKKVPSHLQEVEESLRQALRPALSPSWALSLLLLNV